MQVNGHTSKTANIKKGDNYAACHCQSVDVLLTNVIFV